MYSRLQRAVVRHIEPDTVPAVPAAKPVFRGRLLIETFIGLLLIAGVVGGVILIDDLFLSGVPELLTSE